MSILKIENIIKYICKCDDYFSKEDKTGYSLCVIFCVVEREFPPPFFFVWSRFCYAYRLASTNHPTPHSSTLLHVILKDANKLSQMINTLDTCDPEGFWSFIIGPSRPSKMSFTSI